MEYPATLEMTFHDPRNQIDHVKDHHTTMVEPVNPATTRSPESSLELKRAKVYKLVGTRWADQGTGYCAGQLDDANQACLVVRSELDFDEIILSTLITSGALYERQQESLLVWTEPDGIDYALSFQDEEGCAEVWHFIKEVQDRLDQLESPFVSRLFYVLM